MAGAPPAGQPRRSILSIGHPTELAWPPSSGSSFCPPTDSPRFSTTQRLIQVPGIQPRRRRQPGGAADGEEEVEEVEEEEEEGPAAWLGQPGGGIQTEDEFEDDSANQLRGAPWQTGDLAPP